MNKSNSKINTESKIENIVYITDSELKQDLEYFSELSNLTVRVLDKDRFVITTDTGIATEMFRKYGFYVKRVLVQNKYGSYAGVEVFFER